MSSALWRHDYCIYSRGIEIVSGVYVIGKLTSYCKKQQPKQNRQSNGIAALNITTPSKSPAKTYKTNIAGRFKTQTSRVLWVVNITLNRWLLFSVKWIVNMSKKLSESAENGMSSSLTIDMASSLQKMSINSGPHDDNDDTMKQLLCEIFGLTIRPDDHHHQPLVLIESESAEHAVFERLMLAEPETKLVRPSSSKKSTQLDSHFVQTDVISYLFECYRRILQREKSANAKHITELKRIVLRNVNTILQEPALFETQEVTPFCISFLFQLF